MVAIPYSSRVWHAGEARLAAVQLWLGSLILLIFVMVLVGGATRLTESGLSITEWNLVMGSIPPLGHAAWEDAFGLYRRSPQYELLNRGMSLAEFKTIFWWEWAHRELGRFIGVVYIIGFLWFAVRRTVPPSVLVLLAGIGLLLGAQGLIGWMMVASGLEPGMTAVAPVKLTLHLTLACLFFAAVVTTFVRLGGAAREPLSSGTCWWARSLVALAFVQIALGGLVAGHDAGLTYNTWPLMGGRFVPAGMLALDPAWLNLIENVATIQFDHRMGAYVLTAAALTYAIVMRRASAPVRARALLVLALVLTQTVLGIATLLHVVPVGLALAHQGFAMILLFALVWNASVLRRV